MTDNIDELVTAMKEKRVTLVDRPFVERMMDRFDRWTPAGILERIKEAKAHPNWKKYDDKQRYITGWLRRDYERIFGSNSNGKSRQHLRSNPKEPEDSEQERLERLRKIRAGLPEV